MHAGRADRGDVPCGRPAPRGGVSRADAADLPRWGGPGRQEEVVLYCLSPRTVTICTNRRAAHLCNAP